MAGFLHYAGLSLLCAVSGGVCLAPLLIPALIRRADVRAAAKRAQQSAPSIDSKETQR